MKDALSNFMCDHFDMSCLDSIDLDLDHHHQHQLNYFQSSSPYESNIYTLNSALHNSSSDHHQQNTTTKPPLPADMKRVTIKSRNLNSCTSATPNAEMVSTTTSPAALISFNNSNSTANNALVLSSEKNYIVGSIGTNTRSPSYARDHVIAERKRRVKLNQMFIALSAVVPGLKKMDRTSVLGDAINYVKHLEERVKTLEEQQEIKTENHKPVILMKKSLLCTVEDYLSDNDMVMQPLPEIEARVSNKDVLIRIYCEKQYGGCNLANLLTKIENLHLTIVSTSALPLGSSTIDITIVAQMDVEFCMTHNELKEKLRQALLM
ncbi:transcription factor bHLH19-like [Humulus lupulus]|uniref:transcription factor bHLH19-like n=1 Tax=Humulus lupulus TaxID=3486 RepID=UPI002B409467|nr:transcription factor bHLH19-like [Humulus lupulus]